MADPRLLLLAAALAAGALATPAGAGEAQDRLFAVGVLDAVPTGQTLVFDHTRTGTFDQKQLTPIPDGRIELTLAERAEATGREARVTLAAAGVSRPVPPLPAGAGHPLLLIFLEQSARDVAALTGGSPFYIRNRIREALGAQDTARAGRARRSRAARSRASGELPAVRRGSEPRAPRRVADLELAVVLSEAVPGRLRAASSRSAGPAPTGCRS